MLVAEAERRGVKIRLGSDVVRVNCDKSPPSVSLSSGEEVVADAVIGADGETP